MRMFLTHNYITRVLIILSIKFLNCLISFEPSKKVIRLKYISDQSVKRSFDYLLEILALNLPIVLSSSTM